MICQAVVRALKIVLEEPNSRITEAEAVRDAARLQSNKDLEAKREAEAEIKRLQRIIQDAGINRE